MVAVRHAADQFAESGEEQGGRPRHPGDPSRSAARRSVLRRRRTILLFGGAAASLAVGAIGTDSLAVWASFVAVVSVASIYLGLLHRMRRIAAEREFAAIFGSSLAEVETLSDVPHLSCADPEERSPVASLDVENRLGPLNQTAAIAHFALSSLAGWALSPVVFVLTLILGETPKDTTGRRWLVALESTQRRLKEQSLRTIAVSAATTASVTAAGTVAAFGAPGMASAAAITATASAPAGSTIAASIGAPASVGAVAYRVVGGDTLSGIATRFGTTVGSLASANHINNPNLIFAGQVLSIPGGSDSTTPSGSATYTVVRGDTLSAVAARFGTTTSALAAVNGITNPNLIYVGQILKLTAGAPTATLVSTTRPATAPTSTPAAPTPAAPPAETSAGQVAAQVALAQVGKPYEWAGAGPGSFDCSGLVMYAWARAGVALAHYSVAQYEETGRISESQLRPGDLVFYDTGSGAQPGHVTVYVGDTQVVTADSPGTFVKVVPLTWDGTPMGFGRVG